MAAIGVHFGYTCACVAIFKVRSARFNIVSARKLRVCCFNLLVADTFLPGLEKLIEMLLPIHC